MAAVFQIAGLCLAVSVLAALLRADAPEIGLLLSAAAALVSGAVLLRGAAAAAELGEELIGLTGLAPALFTPLLKVIAVALVARVASALCADAGQSAAARIMDAAGAFCALGCAVPLLEEVVGLLRRWL